MGSVVIGGPAPSLESGTCADTTCSECREHYLDVDPGTVWYQCVDTKIYRYGNKCGNSENKDKCMTDLNTYCHKSYPLGDSKKFKSDEMACRTVPTEFSTGVFDYHSRRSRSSTCGLCTYGCGNQAECHRSWL